MYEIPTSLTIEEQSFAIRNRGDYRMVLDCFCVLNDTELTEEERLYACLLIFYDDMKDLRDLNKFPNIQEAIIKMYDFFNCGQEQSGNKVNYKLIDWEQDSQIICAAINKVSGKEIRFEPYMHWWTFMGYYYEVGESTLSTVVSIRNKIIKGKKLEKHENAFRRDNSQYFTWKKDTIQDKEDKEWIKKVWNSEG